MSINLRPMGPDIPDYTNASEKLASEVRKQTKSVDELVTTKVLDWEDEYGNKGRDGQPDTSLGEGLVKAIFDRLGVRTYLGKNVDITVGVPAEEVPSEKIPEEA